MSARARLPVLSMLLALCAALVAGQTSARPLRPDEQARQQAQGPTTVVARLIDLGATTAPQCGTLHVGVVMRYEVREVFGERPFYGPSGDVWDVVHGCPEVPRARYQAGSGDLNVFRVGDLHRLVLSLRPPANPPATVVDLWPRTSRNPALWALRTDRASAP